MTSLNQLRDVEPFNQLPEEALAPIESSLELKKFPPGGTIFNQNDPPTGFLYVIKSGLVEITAITPGGMDMVVDYRKEGQFFGGTPVFTGGSYSGGARTIKATECFLIPEDILRETAKQIPQFAESWTTANISLSKRKKRGKLRKSSIPLK